MNDREWLGQRFEAHRDHLRAVACRMLGSLAEAEDAVQEAWLRLARADTDGVQNLRGLVDHRGGPGVLGHAARPARPT